MDPVAEELDLYSLRYVLLDFEANVTYSNLHLHFGPVTGLGLLGDETCTYSDHQNAAGHGIGTACLAESTAIFNIYAICARQFAMN